MSPPGSKPSVPSYDAALAMILPHAPALGEEAVPLENALGRVLRRAVVADRDQPPFDRSAMDGFAVRSREVTASSSFPVAGAVAAGGERSSFEDEMPAGAVKRIATGAPLPRGADAVVPIEQANVGAGVLGLGSGGGKINAALSSPQTSDPSPQPPPSERVSFIVDAAAAWQNVHRRASDASAGQTLLAAGTRLGPQHIGIAAAVGAATLAVSQRPRVTLLTTGDEVVPPSTATASLQPQHIRNSNGPLLAALLESLGCPLLRHVHVPDDPEETRAAAREALSHSHVVVTVGGVSVGQRDFLPPAWHHLGLETIVHGVNIQPGKPLFVARDDSKLVIGLPGNPVSVLATAHLFLRPVLLRVLGREPATLPWRTVKLAAAVKASSRRQVFRAATLGDLGSATVIQWHGSGDLVHTAAADGFVRLPLQDAVEQGTEVPFLPLT